MRAVKPLRTRIIYPDLFLLAAFIVPIYQIDIAVMNFQGRHTAFSGYTAGIKNAGNQQDAVIQVTAHGRLALCNPVQFLFIGFNIRNDFLSFLFRRLRLQAYQIFNLEF